MRCLGVTVHIRQSIRSSLMRTLWLNSKEVSLGPHPNTVVLHAWPEQPCKITYTANSTSKYWIVTLWSKDTLRSDQALLTPRYLVSILIGSYHIFATVRPGRNHDDIIREKLQYEPRECISRTDGKLIRYDTQYYVTRLYAEYIGTYDPGKIMMILSEINYSTNHENAYHARMEN
jgi:hypothetical protein